MNAADQRRLTPVLGMLCALAALLLVILVVGYGRGVRWDAPGSAAPLPVSGTVARNAAPPLQRFAEVWRAPLFSTDRKPAPGDDSGDENVTLGDLQLTGIIITPDLRMALLNSRSGVSVRVGEGQEVANTGWTLVKLEPRSAVFSRNGQRIELKLKTAGPAQASVVAPAVRVGQGAALWMRTHSGGRLQTPLKEAHEAAGQRMQQRRVQALKARIDSRRRQLQAQREREH